MWTKQNRSRYNRDGLRYESDLTDAEWAVLQPLIPRPKRGGRPRQVNEREIINGILYILSTGCQWRQIPKDLPPYSTLYSYLKRFEWMAPWYAYTTSFMCDVASRRAVRQAPPSALLIVRA